MINITTFANTWKPRLLLLVLGSAFVLSYSALFQQAIAAGYSPWLGWGWPLLVDGVVLFAVLSLAERQTRGLSTGFVWFVLIVFDAASIALNASYGFQLGWQAALVHSLPAAVAPLMLKLFTNDIKDTEAAKQAITAQKQAAKRAVPKAANKAENPSKAAFGPQNLPAAHEAKASKIEARRAQIIELKADDPDLTAPQLAAMIGASADTIRRDLKALNGKVRHTNV